MNNIKYVKLISNIKFATIRYKDSTLGTKNIRLFVFKDKWKGRYQNIDERS
jgi:hypothetical protein